MQKTKNETVKFSRNKITSVAIALLMIFSMTASLMFVPSVNAHTPPLNIPTWTFVSTAPQTVGVNQEVMIVMWQNILPPTANGQYGDRWTFMVNVMKPDGTNDTLGPFTSDPTGSTYTEYIPTETGNYTVQATTLGHTLSNQPNGVNPIVGTTTSSSFNNINGNITAYLGDYFEPSTSIPVTLVVEQTPIPYYQETPLPAAYWTRPIYGTNHNWYEMAGQWLGGGDSTPSGSRANLYTEGPTSAHIDWAVPFGTGGLTGGGSSYTFYAANEYSGQSYETITGPSIIEDGLLYYTVSSPPREGWYALNLYTGQVAYFENTTGAVTWAPSSHDTGSIPYGAPAFGQVLDYESPNQHGTFDYIWVTNTGVSGKWNMLDAYTGNYICSIANVTQSAKTAAKTTVTTGATGTSKTDSIGSICYYNIVNLGNTTTPAYYLQVWNTTQAIMALAVSLTSQNSNAYWEYKPVLNYTFDGSQGFSVNASIPAVQGSIFQVVTDQYIIGGTSGNITANPGQNTSGNLWALNLNPAQGAIGSLLWNITFVPPAGYPDSSIMKIVNTGDDHDPAFGGLDAQAGIFYFTNTIANTYSVYSLATGNLLWTSAPLPQWAYYGMSTSIFGGVLYSYGYDGVLIAFNATTGNILWEWAAPNVGLGETPYPNTPLSWGCATNGTGQTLIYMYSNEHSVNAPIRRDACIWCINATDGTMIWQLNGWPCTSPIVADGRLVYANCQDMQIYCFGPGLSKTTVSAPQNGVSAGSIVMITGTVTDDTPSGKDQGTPAISDASMTQWMGYLYQQQPFPTNATGVPVSLDAIDPNNNYIHIGDVTSDATGAYGCEFTPQVPGTYHVIATFAGSNSYGSSIAETYMAAGPAAATPAPTQAPLNASAIESSLMSYVIVAAIAIIIAIAIATILMLRKHA